MSTCSSPNTASSHLVCLSEYIKYLVHLLLGNTGVFPVCMYMELYRLELFILKKKISKSKLPVESKASRGFGMVLREACGFVGSIGAIC